MIVQDFFFSFVTLVDDSADGAPDTSVGIDGFVAEGIPANWN